MCTIIPRITIRQAVEQIASELDGRTSLTDIAQEAARRAGRSYTKYARRTAAEVLSRCRQVVRCARGVYAPARVALDGKAFRVQLHPVEVECARLPLQRLEPFYQALGDPPVCTANGRELPIKKALADEPEQYRTSQQKQGANNEIHVTFPTEAQAVLMLEPDWRIRGEDWFRPELNGVYIDLTELGLTSDAVNRDRAGSDLIVRWDHDANILKVTISPDVVEEVAQTVAHEDRVLAQFLFDKLPDRHAVYLPSFLLEAYASCPEVGRTPGSTVGDVLGNNEDLRVLRSDGWNMVRMMIARYYVKFESDRERERAEFEESVRNQVKHHVQEYRDVLYNERQRLGLIGSQRSAKVVLLHKPSHRDLIAEWEEVLRQRQVSDSMRKRKVRHLEEFVQRLEANDRDKPLHLFDVDDVYLERFFFWTYILEHPYSSWHATTLAIDLWEFYKHQEHMGRMMDVRFAEFIYRVRWLLSRRFYAYLSLKGLSHHVDVSDLCKMVFQGSCAGCDDNTEYFLCRYGL